MKKFLSVMLAITLIAGIVIFTGEHGSPLHTAHATEPDGAEGNPYIITTAKQLADLAAEVNAGDGKAGKYYQLGNDIDLSEYGKGSDFNDGKGWEPIGKNDDASNYSKFNGNFDGAGNKITGRERKINFRRHAGHSRQRGI